MWFGSVTSHEAAPAILGICSLPSWTAILELRVQMRAAGEYALADKLRDALVDAGIEVRDTPEGSVWELAVTTPA